MPPNILFSVRPGSGPSAARSRWAAPSSYAICPSVSHTSNVTCSRNVGGFLTFVACSNAYANRISCGSLQAAPMNEMPTGSPKM